MANNPAGEISLNLRITGPHYTLGAACAAGNAGIIQGVQMLRLGDCDIALSGGVSESIHTFGIFASFHSQGALARHEDPAKASRPFDLDRNGIVVAEGGCLFVLERLPRRPGPRGEDLRRSRRLCDEQRRDAISSCRTRAGRPSASAWRCAGRRWMPPRSASSAPTPPSTASGDAQECQALREVWGSNGHRTLFNNTKSFIGHAMGAAGALELAGNLPAFDDGICHATINLDRLDPQCELPGLVANQPRQAGKIDAVLNNSFGMLGINSVVIVKRI